MDSVMHGLLDIHYEGYFTFEAGNTPLPARQRRKFEEDTRCLQLPVEFKKSMSVFSMRSVGMCCHSMAVLKNNR